MGILLWIVFGAIAGWVAGVLTGRSLGLLGDIIVGIIGALLGGWLSTALGGPPVNGFNFVSFIIAIAGSIILLLIVGSIRRQPRI
jgi:uncharacterized membrane protein YeaQ/YmgE (transglycosylase-associated protein family)